MAGFRDVLEEYARAVLEVSRRNGEKFANGIPSREENPDGLHRRYLVLKEEKFTEALLTDLAKAGYEEFRLAKADGKYPFWEEMDDDCRRANEMMVLRVLKEMKRRAGEPGAEYFVLRLDSEGDDPGHIEASRAAMAMYGITRKTREPAGSHGDRLGGECVRYVDMLLSRKPTPKDAGERLRALADEFLSLPEFENYCQASMIEEGPTLGEILAEVRTRHGVEVEVREVPCEGCDGPGFVIVGRRPISPAAKTPAHERRPGPISHGEAEVDREAFLRPENGTVEGGGVHPWTGDDRPQVDNKPGH